MIESFPGLLSDAVSTLNEEQLQVTYREGGWCSRQVVHHCADSPLNAFIRFHLALTEEGPAIRPYFEDRWAMLPDYAIPVDVSLELLRALHIRWCYLLRAMKENEWAKTYIHPEYKTTFYLYEVLAMYAWHCRHHLAHINSLKSRMSWQ